MKEEEKHQGTPVAINSRELTHPQTVCYFLPLTLTEIQMMTENKKLFQTDRALWRIILKKLLVMLVTESFFSVKSTLIQQRNTFG